MADPKDSLASFRRLSGDYMSQSFLFELTGSLHGKTLTDPVKTFTVEGQAILQAIVERVSEIKAFIKEVKQFKMENYMVLTTAVANCQDVRFAVEFVIKEPKQLRNSKSLEAFVTKNCNVEIKSVIVQACFNFDRAQDDTLSTAAVLKHSNMVHRY